VTDAASTTERPPGPSAKVALIVMGLGVLMGVVGLVGLIVGVARTVLTPSHAIPGEFQMQLGTGEWTIFQHTARDVGSADDIGPSATVSIEAPRVTIEAIRVTKLPDGTGLPVRASSRSETFTRNRDVFTPIARFDVPADGRYSIRIPADRPGKVIVSKGVFAAFARIAVWAILMLVGGLDFVVGTVMLLVGIMRRSRAPATQPPLPAATP
jgi:hypothetical protein